MWLMSCNLIIKQYSYFNEMDYENILTFYSYSIHFLDFLLARKENLLEISWVFLYNSLWIFKILLGWVECKTSIVYIFKDNF